MYYLEVYFRNTIYVQQEVNIESGKLKIKLFSRRFLNTSWTLISILCAVCYFFK